MQERPNTFRITEIAPHDRPRERLAKLGPQAMSDAELLSILLRVGVQGENAIQVGLRLLGQFGVKSLLKLAPKVIIHKDAG